jgi:hypothetical protein
MLDELREHVHGIIQLGPAATPTPKSVRPLSVTCRET